MGDEHDRLLQAALDAQELVLHLAPDQRVEGGERLVEEPQLRLHRQRPGDAHPLLLSARELAREGCFTSFQTHELNDAAHPFVAFRHGQALQAQREGDVVEDVQMGEQPEVLEHHPHLVTADVDQLPGGLVEQVLAVEPHFAASRLDETGQASHDGGLSGAGQPHDDEDLADVDVEAHVDDGGNGAVRAHAAREPARIVGGDVPVEVGRRLAAIDLPDVAAGQLDRFAVTGPGLHASACRYPEESGHKQEGDASMLASPSSLGHQLMSSSRPSQPRPRVPRSPRSRRPTRRSPLRACAPCCRSRASARSARRCRST